MGISKVEEAGELRASLVEAFKFDSKVVCEKFIPLGREIRVAVVEDEAGEPSILLPASSSTTCLLYTSPSPRDRG